MKLATFSLLAVTGVMFLAPPPAPAANKDMEELQRDVAGLGDQVRDLDKKINGIQTTLQQALDTANKTNSSVTTLNTSVAQTMQSQLKGVTEQLSSVTGLSVKLDNASNDIAALSSAVSGLVTTVNRQQQMLNDINNQLKLMQTPAAAPPPVDASAGAPASATPPPPSAQTLFTNGVRDENGGHADLALAGFQEFLKSYPDDPNADKAQYEIGNIYYHSGRLEDAVKAFDAVIERYSDATSTAKAGAFYMKGMALVKDRKKPEAILSFREVIKRFPHSDEAAQAKTQLTSLGASASAPATRKGR